MLFRSLDWRVCAGIVTYAAAGTIRRWRTSWATHSTTTLLDEWSAAFPHSFSTETRNFLEEIIPPIGGDARTKYNSLSVEQIARIIFACMAGSHQPLAAWNPVPAALTPYAEDQEVCSLFSVMSHMTNVIFSPFPCHHPSNQHRQVLR